MRPAVRVLVALSLAIAAAPGVESQSASDVESVESAAPARLRPPASLADIIERAGRWTVAIEVERESEEGGRRGGGRRMSAEARTYYRRPAGPVSGVLTDKPGEIITSYYNVMGNVKSLRVTFPDGTTLEGSVVARSEARDPVEADRRPGAVWHDDLALIRTRGTAPAPSPAPEWADWKSLKTGMFVVAAGRSPDPRRVTVTTGIISALGRNGNRTIQTDAELNYGNSGGPILDLRGRIVALATLVGHTDPYRQWGFNSGVGFGVSASTVLETLPVLASGKNAAAPPPPVLGVVQKDLDKPDVEGARVSDLTVGGAAALVGIRKGDVITELDGIPIHSFEHLRRLVYSRKGGEVVKLKIRRGAEVIEVEPRLRGAP
jgi:putative serine protease PepD